MPAPRADGGVESRNRVGSPIAAPPTYPNAPPDRNDVAVTNPTSTNPTIVLPAVPRDEYISSKDGSFLFSVWPPRVSGGGRTPSGAFLLPLLNRRREEEEEEEEEEEDDDDAVNATSVVGMCDEIPHARRRPKCAGGSALRLPRWRYETGTEVVDEVEVPAVMVVAAAAAATTAMVRRRKTPRPLIIAVAELIQIR